MEGWGGRKKRGGGGVLEKGECGVGRFLFPSTLPTCLRASRADSDHLLKDQPNAFPSVLDHNAELACRDSAPHYCIYRPNLESGSGSTHN